MRKLLSVCYSIYNTVLRFSKQCDLQKSRQSALRLALGGECRHAYYTFHRLSQYSCDVWVKDRNPKQLRAVAEECGASQTSRKRRGATGTVGQGGAADPHGRIERSGVTSRRPVTGSPRGIKFTCGHTTVLGRAVNGEASGLDPRYFTVAALGHGYSDAPLAGRTSD